jgi:hypothetical protein
LHFDGDESEIDDNRFFLSAEGKTSPYEELHATIDSLVNENYFDDNATACRFPARRDWLVSQLNMKNLPNVSCTEFDIVMKKLRPKSATLIFPAAHINSPASMFGHTLLRINSDYNSKLLSYAVNYAANADPTKENALLFSVKGLFGGYFGKYSLLPYYDKLKEYRDAESRDVWEYDLNLTQEETIRMLKHIWELNGTNSYYYFFTENCSYNMLWFLESARDDIRLRDQFWYQIIPLETVHAVANESLISNYHYRPSKRTKLLHYEQLIYDELIKYVEVLAYNDIDLETFINDESIELEQKQYILEASIEYLEYTYKNNEMDKTTYLEYFHNLSTARSSLGKGKPLRISTPANPIDSHQANRFNITVGSYQQHPTIYLGYRPAYHSLDDSLYGYMRGTQIEFLNIDLSYNKEEGLELEEATLLSIVSIAPITQLVKNFSWRTKMGYDKDFLRDEHANFSFTFGAGASVGGKYGYLYTMLDPFIYIYNKASYGIGSSLGFMLDYSKYFSTFSEATVRVHEDGELQYLFNIDQSFRTSQNTRLGVEYRFKTSLIDDIEDNIHTIKASLKLYF